MSVNTYNKILTKGPESALPNTYEDGKLRFTTDTGRMFVDNTNERIEITDFVKGLTEEEITNQFAPLVSKIYIASDTDKMMYYDTTSGWVELNSAEADYATNAGTATYANNAASATNASSAVYATNADTAAYATNSGTATYATNAGTSTYATKASSSDIATNATSADFAVNATSAVYATNASTADYATNASSSVYATNADTSSYAVNSSSAVYATNASSATYSTNAGDACRLRNLTAIQVEDLVALDFLRQFRKFNASGTTAIANCQTAHAAVEYIWLEERTECSTTAR